MRSAANTVPSGGQLGPSIGAVLRLHRHRDEHLGVGLGRIFEPGENLRRLRAALARDQSGDGRRDLCPAANGRLDRVSEVLIAIADQAQVDERQAAREASRAM